MPFRTDPARRAGAALVAATLAMGLAAALTGCATGRSDAGTGSSSPSPAIGTSARLGSLRVTGAYVPTPASPDVAAAYFTVRNDGDAADALTAVRSDVSTDTGLHGYSSPGHMVDLPTLAIPAHGRAALKVGSTHVMIMNPTRALTTGQKVTLTLTFTHAGPLTITVPVVSATGPADTMPSGAMPSGMHMTGTGG